MQNLNETYVKLVPCTHCMERPEVAGGGDGMQIEGRYVYVDSREWSDL